MKVVILTTSVRGTASKALTTLCNRKDIDVVKVVLASGGTPNRKRSMKRKYKKICKIGIFGALNGFRMRDWYSYHDVDHIESLCNTFNVELSKSPFINCEETREMFRESRADLGLSLGCGYIAKSVFSIPKYGMINIHTEILPDFQGAQSIIWPLYEGVQETGFTIHQIDDKIDTGVILFQERFSIKIYPTLRRTVEKNLMVTRQKLPDALAYVCENYIALKAKAIPQEKGRSYTTPSVWQFFRMLINHKAMYKEYRSKHGAHPGVGQTHNPIEGHQRLGSNKNKKIENP